MSLNVKMAGNHIEADIHITGRERYVLKRLLREKRNGKVEQLDEQTWRYTADVFEPMEMLPWLRTFIGRIKRLSCTDRRVERLFWKDLAALERMYLTNAEDLREEGEESVRGGKDDAIQ